MKFLIFPCIIQLQSVQRRPHLSPHRQIYNKNGINLRSADGRNRYIPQSATRVPPQQAKLAHDQTKHTITILKKWAIPMRRKNPHALKKACGLLRREVTELTDGRGMQHMEIPLRRYKSSPKKYLQNSATRRRWRSESQKCYSASPR